MYYFYDGSFLGFLSLIYELFLIRNFDVIILKNTENSIFGGNFIQTSIENSQKVYDKLIKFLGKDNFEKIYICFLSEEKGIELHLLNYIKLGLKFGKNIDKYYLPETKKVEDLCKKTNHEAHKFKGLLRFRKLSDNTFFAIINPDSNVLPLIKEHFIDRFNDQNFVIFDEKRDLALLFDSSSKINKIKQIKEFDIRLKDYKNIDLLHKEEIEYTKLWKGYFKSICIEERTNLSLQKSHMPQKYWENLVETKS